MGKPSSLTAFANASRYAGATHATTRRGRQFLDPRWRLLPARSAANVPAFVALLGRGLDVTVFVDAGPGLQRLCELATHGLLDQKRIVTVGTALGAKNADIEDVFSVGDYLTLYNGAFGTRLKESDLPPGDRIVHRIGRLIGTPFTDHGPPADWFLRNRSTGLDALDPDTLERFERVIGAINATVV